MNVDGRRKLVEQVAKRVDQVLAELVDGADRVWGERKATWDLLACDVIE